MTIDWRTTALDPLDALLATSLSTTLRRVAESVRTKLSSTGNRYDMFFPPLPAPDTPSVLVEKTEHVMWRTVAMPAALEDLDKIGQLADGLPATTIGSDLQAATATILKRLQDAIRKKSGPGMNPVGVALAGSALSRVASPLDSPLPLPPEPTFFVAGYSEALAGDKYGQAYGTRGAAEEAMVAALAEAAAVLELAA